MKKSNKKAKKQWLDSQQGLEEAEADLGGIKEEEEVVKAGQEMMDKSEILVNRSSWLEQPDKQVSSSRSRSIVLILSK